MVSPSTDGAIVRVAGIQKRYRHRLAVRGVDLTVYKGEMYGLIGPDGAGKSSLMKAIAGVLTFEGGELDVFGVRVNSERSAERVKPRLGFLPQGLGQNLYPELSVEENVNFFGRLRLISEQELTERKSRLLALTRLEAFRDRSMKHLSGGMKQKLALVCTLIHEPELIILDEPTTGVDPVSRRDFWAILSEFVQERGLSAFVSTAYMDEAARFHRVSLMFQGQILASGTPSEVRAIAPGSLVTVQVEPQVEALSRLRGAFAQVETMGRALRVFVDHEDQEAAVGQVREQLHNLDVHDLLVEEPEPEDAFVALLRRKGLVPAQTAPPVGTSPVASTDGLAIDAEALTKDFGTFRAVDGVSFQVQQGEIFGLLGANGAGKTTVIKMLTGILRPTGGHGRVAGADMRRAGTTIKERIGYVSQAFSLYLDLTVIENIRLFAGVYGLGKADTTDRLDWVLNMASLVGYESQLAGRLPMGVRQRLALGCALVHRPRVLFLDEPTSGVDPIGRRRFWETLLRLSREERVAALVTTHYMSEAEHCDRLALMYAGRIVSEGSPMELKEEVAIEAGTLLKVITDEPIRALSCLERSGLRGAALFGMDVHVLSQDPERDAALVKHTFMSSGLKEPVITSRSPTLEDVFVYRIMSLEQDQRA